MLLMGDFNAAPKGGRWNYVPWSATSKADREMDEWVSNDERSLIQQNEIHDSDVLVMKHVFL